MSAEEQQQVAEFWKAKGAKGFGYYNDGSMHIDFRDSAAAWGPNRSKSSLPKTPSWFQKFASNLS
jgi:hypothetical protein